MKLLLHNNMQNKQYEYMINFSNICILLGKKIISFLFSHACYLKAREVGWKPTKVTSKRIGRLLGYPTANIEPDYKYKLIPAEGVYAASCSIDKKDYKSMLYIGKRPTIEACGERRIEVNIFDFEGDLYGKSLTVTFKHRIREDMKFDNRDLLMEQISNW